MDENTVIGSATVTNPQGLHARPADLFVKMASRFTSQVEVSKDGQWADGKSILGVLTLVAEQGSEIKIRAAGPDAQLAVSALVELVADGFREHEHEVNGKDHES